MVSRGDAEYDTSRSLIHTMSNLLPHRKTVRMLPWENCAEQTIERSFSKVKATKIETTHWH
jgi:hypothetical protein